MTVLVTFFEPFDGRKTNLSQLAVEKLRSRKSSVAWKKEGVVFVLLPVTFSKVEGILEKLIKKHAVSRLLLTGESRKAPKIQLERLALNVAHAAIADNSGTRYNLTELEAAESLALMTQCDIEALSTQMKKAGLPNRISHHAGTFVCNAAYYHGLKNCKESLFIHLPAKLPGGRKKFGKSHIDCLADAIGLAVDFMVE